MREILKLDTVPARAQPLIPNGFVFNWNDHITYLISWLDIYTNPVQDNPRYIKICVGHSQWTGCIQPAIMVKHSLLEVGK